MSLKDAFRFTKIIAPYFDPAHPMTTDVLHEVREAAEATSCSIYDNMLWKTMLSKKGKSDTDGEDPKQKEPRISAKTESRDPPANGTSSQNHQLTMSESQRAKIQKWKQQKRRSGGKGDRCRENPNNPPIFQDEEENELVKSLMKLSDEELAIKEAEMQAECERVEGEVRRLQEKHEALTTETKARKQAVEQFNGALADIDRPSVDACEVAIYKSERVAAYMHKASKVLNESF